MLRGRLTTLLARREIGGLLQEYARHYPRDRQRFEAFAKQTCDLGYSDARRHIQLWVHWPRCRATLERLEADAIRRDEPFSLPGLRRLLAMAGVIGKRPLPLPPDEVDEPEELEWIDAELPDDPAALRRIIERLRKDNRVLREEVVLLRNEIRHLPNPRRTRPAT
ncbi:MAG TPA: hypothetical protein VFL55_02030 [Acetobacteraceae bacterium]|nr:hypothetical protein [Acetobacteraceae bacterium]